MPDVHSHAILVVEDHDGLREATCFLLEAEGFVATAARSGYEALQMFANGYRPCLALLDVHMPGMDGWEVARRLAADPTTAAVPLVMLSGDAQVVRAYQRHEVGMLGKPVDPAELLATLSERACCPPQSSETSASALHAVLRADTDRSTSTCALMEPSGGGSTKRLPGS